MRPFVCSSPFLLLALGACSLPTASRPAEEEDEVEVAELPPISPNRPTFSDGTSLVPLGHAQLETGYTYTERDRSGTETERHNAPELLARYRVFEGLEARLLWNGYAWTRTDDGTTTDHDAGGTDVAVALVTPLVDQQGAVPALALEVLSTLGTGSPDFSTREIDPTVKLLWSYGAGHFPDWLGIGGNLIASRPSEEGEHFNQTAASLYATISPVGTDTCWFAEWYTVSPYAEHLDAAQNADVGVVQRLSPTTAIDARVGFGLDKEADDFFCGVGFSVLF